MKKILFSLACLFSSIVLFAQDSAVSRAGKEATGLRADGKIYVVVAVLVTILCGLFLYVIRLDRKISRMEKGSLPK